MSPVSSMLPGHSGRKEKLVMTTLAVIGDSTSGASISIICQIKGILELPRMSRCLGNSTARYRLSLSLIAFLTYRGENTYCPHLGSYP